MIKSIERNREGFAASNGYSIVQEKGQVVMIISPENSYYTKEENNNILDHLKCCVGNFSRVYVMIPEGPMIHDYLAEGYDLQSAVRKSRLKCNNLRNKTERSIDALLEGGKNPAGRVKVLDWMNHIEKDMDYAGELCNLKALYANNGYFRTAVDEAVVDVLENRKKRKIGEEAISEGSNYVLKEIAFMAAAPKMFSQDRMCYSYHKSWDIFEDYVNGVFDGKEKEELGFVVIS